MLDRLFDLLLIAVVRAWFARPEADAPAWYRSTTTPSSAAPCGCSTTILPIRGPSPGSRPPQA